MELRVHGNQLNLMVVQSMQMLEAQRVLLLRAALQAAVRPIRIPKHSDQVQIQATKQHPQARQQELDGHGQRVPPLRVRLELLQASSRRVRRV